MQEPDFSRLQESHEKALQASREKMEKWQQFKGDYEALQARLCSLPDHLTYDIMVPFGKYAFMQGQLYHTNEVTVLLGDNWFLKTTTKHALEIIERRKKYVCEMLEKEKELYSDWESRYSFTEQFQETVKDHQDTVEIKEEYVPVSHEKVRKEWKTKGNVPPPRKVLPLKKHYPEDQETKHVAMETAASPQKIIVKHDEESSVVEKTSGSVGERPLFTSPGDISSLSTLTPEDVDDEPVAMTTKQVRWGSNQLLEVADKKSGDRPSLKPFTGQVVERTSPQSVLTSDPTPKKVSRFKSGRAKS